MSSITSLFAYETLPSLLTVTGVVGIVVGLMSDRICNDDPNCKNIVGNVKIAGIVSAVGGLLLTMLAFLGVMSFGGGYGYGGGYGGYGGYGW